MLRRLGKLTRCQQEGSCVRILTVHVARREKGFYFDALDTFWNGQWISIAPRAAFVNFTGLTISSLHETVGLDWALALPGLGVLIRLSTLYFTLYGERAASRMQHAVPLLVPAFTKFEEVYYNPKSTSLAIQIAATELRAERNKTYIDWKTSNKATMASLLGTPAVILGLSAAFRLVEEPQWMAASEMIPWLYSLQLADPTMVLPIVCAAMTLMNLELNLRARKLDRGQQWTQNVAWAMRAGCVCVVPAISTWPSGVLLYWIGLSLGGVAQPLLLRSVAFRRWFGIMDPPSSVAEQDTLQTRFALQMPTLSKVVSPDSEEKMVSVTTARIRAAADAEHLAKVGVSSKSFARRDWNRPSG